MGTPQAPYILTGTLHTGSNHVCRFMSPSCKKPRQINVTSLVILLLFTFLFIPDRENYFLHVNVTEKAQKKTPKGNNLHPHT